MLMCVLVCLLYPPQLLPLCLAGLRVPGLSLSFDPQKTLMELWMVSNTMKLQAPCLGPCIAGTCVYSRGLFFSACSLTQRCSHFSMSPLFVSLSPDMLPVLHVSLCFSRSVLPCSHLSMFATFPLVSLYVSNPSNISPSSPFRSLFESYIYICAVELLTGPSLGGFQTSWLGQVKVINWAKVIFAL